MLGWSHTFVTAFALLTTLEKQHSRTYTRLWLFIFSHLTRLWVISCFLLMLVLLSFCLLLIDSSWFIVTNINFSGYDANQTGCEFMMGYRLMALPLFFLFLLVCVCVCVSVRACMHACVHACVRVLCFLFPCHLVVTLCCHGKQQLAKKKKWGGGGGFFLFFSFFKFSAEEVWFMCRPHFGVHYPGSRDSSMVESWTCGPKVVGSIPARGGGQNFSRVNILFWLLFRCLFTSALLQ